MEKKIKKVEFYNRNNLRVISDAVDAFATVLFTGDGVVFSNLISSSCRDGCFK
jgi:hypothetical protein